MNNPSLASEGRFNYALDIILEHEGGYSNDPIDPGGATNFGITQHELSQIDKEFNLPNDVKNLSRDDASKYYKMKWWDNYHYELIDSIALSTKIFDMAVNMGASQAHKIAQKSCQYCGYSTLNIDGKMGPKTITALNEISLHGREKDLMDEIVSEQKSFYEKLVQDHPQLHIFLKGWLNRAAYQGT